VWGTWANFPGTQLILPKAHHQVPSSGEWIGDETVQHSRGFGIILRCLCCCEHKDTCRCEAEHPRLVERRGRDLLCIQCHRRLYVHQPHSVRRLLRRGQVVGQQMRPDLAIERPSPPTRSCRSFIANGASLDLHNTSRPPCCCCSRRIIHPMCM
jgi:hypothetical protein